MASYRNAVGQNTSRLGKRTRLFIRTITRIIFARVNKRVKERTLVQMNPSINNSSHGIRTFEFYDDRLVARLSRYRVSGRRNEECFFFFLTRWNAIIFTSARGSAPAAWQGIKRRVRLETRSSGYFVSGFMGTLSEDRKPVKMAWQRRSVAEESTRICYLIRERGKKGEKGTTRHVDV